MMNNITIKKIANFLFFHIAIIFTISNIGAQNTDLSSKVELQSEYDSLKNNDTPKKLLDSGNSNSDKEDLNNSDETPEKESSDDLFIIAANYYYQNNYDKASEIIEQIEAKGNGNAELQRIKKHINFYNRFKNPSEKFNINNNSLDDLYIYSNVFSRLASDYPWVSQFRKNTYLIHFHIYKNSGILSEKIKSAFFIVDYDIKRNSFLNTEVYLFFLKQNLPAMSDIEKSRFYYYAGKYFLKKPLSDVHKGSAMLQKSASFQSGIYSDNAARELHQLNNSFYR